MTSVSLTSFGKLGRTCPILSRTSCIAFVMSVDMRNSANTWLWPSFEFDRMRLAPETVLIAYSSGLVTSVSTTSGLAPGYAVNTSTNGRLTSGICSTLSRLYAKRPNTAMPIITIVAKTGFLMETRVIHMVALPSFLASGALPGRLRAAGGGHRRRCRCREGCRRGCLDDRRRPVLQVVEARGQHRGVRRQRGLDLHPPHGVVAATGRDEALYELAAFDGPHECLPRLRAHGRGRQRGHWRAGGERDAARGEHSAADRAIGIWDSDVHQDGSRARLGRRIDALDTPGEPAIAEAVDRELHRFADSELRHIDGRYRSLQLHIGQVDNRDERRVEGHLLADLDVALRHDTRQRGRGDGVAQCVPRELN